MNRKLVTPIVFCVSLLALACGTPKPTASAADVPQTSSSSESILPEAQAEEPATEEDTTPQPSAEPPTTTKQPSALEQGQVASKQEQAAPEPKEPKETETVADKTDLDTYVVPQGPSKTFKTINENLFQINACYLRELTGKNAHMKGLLEIEFTVNMKGRIIKSSITKNELNKAVADCVLEELKKLEYPKPKYAPETFRFPFTFSPAH